MGPAAVLTCIDGAAVPDLDDEYGEFFIFDLAEKAIVSDAVTPEARQLVEQRLAEVAGIGCCGYSLVKVAEDAALDGAIQFGEVAVSFVAELNPPSHTCDRSLRG